MKNYIKRNLESQMNNSKHIENLHTAHEFVIDELSDDCNLLFILQEEKDDLENLINDWFAKKYEELE